MFPTPKNPPITPNPQKLAQLGDIWVADNPGFSFVLLPIIQDDNKITQVWIRYDNNHLLQEWLSKNYKHIGKRLSPVTFCYPYLPQGHMVLSSKQIERAFIEPTRLHNQILLDKLNSKLKYEQEDSYGEF